MLNITRKVGEKIVIGEDVILEVMEVSGSSVRLGIQAPRSVPVYREEIWEAVRAENAAAARSATTKLPEPKVPVRAGTGNPHRPSVRTVARKKAQDPTNTEETASRSNESSNAPVNSAPEQPKT
ncbi:MAG: carbon storage regulator CsrA [Solirubrobacteraceae bacterium]|nr:carbon storage regulator CsrA [Patulibacter sp.]